MRRLIVNADDLGWSEDVTAGILHAHREGIVTSTTLMANLPGADGTLDRARREAPALGLGLHLNLTEGEPLSPAAEVSAILDRSGRFTGGLAGLLMRTQWSRAARGAVAKELAAQAAWASDHGWKPTHYDGHKHVHLHPAVLDVVLELAVRHGVRAVRVAEEMRLSGMAPLLPKSWGAKARTRQWLLARVSMRWGKRARRRVKAAGLATTDWFFGVRATGGVSAELLCEFLRRAPEGTGELMVHPGFREKDPQRRTRLVDSRQDELAAVCDPRVREAVKQHGWKLITYGEISVAEPREETA
jgi:hopanoid biosynthesis associated protein HpnK